MHVESLGGPWYEISSLYLEPFSHIKKYKLVVPPIYLSIILPKTKEIGFDTPGPRGAGSTELSGPTRLSGPTGHATFTLITRLVATDKPHDVSFSLARLRLARSFVGSVKGATP